LKSSQSRYAELDKLIQRIYEDMVAQKISDKRFEVLSNQYEQEQTELEQLIAQLEADLDSFDDSADRAVKFLELTKRYKEFATLTPTRLHEFVDCIEVHERADKRAIVTTQKVDVYLNFIGTYQPTAEQLEKAGRYTEEEPTAEDVAAHEERMAKLLYQREYKKRREANGGRPLGHFMGKRLDKLTPEERAAYDAKRKVELKAYHAKWYQDNKERMKAEQVAKRAAMTPEERAEAIAKRTASQREYQKNHRERNREKHNAYMRERRKSQREQNAGQEREQPQQGQPA
jgi:hypothetical protein